MGNEILNGNFADATLTGILETAGVFGNASLWAYSPTYWSISGGNATKTAGGDNQSLTYKTDVTAYQSLKQVLCIASISNGHITDKFSFWGTTRQYDSVGTFTTYDVNKGDNPTSFTLSAVNTTGTIVLDYIRLYITVPSNWERIGSELSTTNYTLYNDESSTVQLVSPIGSYIGYSQAVDNGTYNISVTLTATAGGLLLTDGGSNSQLITSTGTTTFDLKVDTGYIQFRTVSSSASNVVVGKITQNSYTLPPVKPVASFTASINNITKGQSVTFTDTSTNTPTSWAWDFGDGGSSTLQNPTHKFNTVGTFTVTMTATNLAGTSDAVTKNIFVNDISTDFGERTMSFLSLVTLADEDHYKTDEVVYEFRTHDFQSSDNSSTGFYKK